MNISLHDRFAVPADVVFRHLDDEAVLLNLKSGTYFGLNELGARIWALLGERRALEDVLEILADEYDAARPVLERDLLDLTQELCEKGLLQIDAA